jgi:beta-mannosidase
MPGRLLGSCGFGVCATVGKISSKDTSTVSHSLLHIKARTTMAPSAAGLTFTCLLVTLHANLILASSTDRWIRKTSVAPSWQSVVSDTGLVLPLFGNAYPADHQGGQRSNKGAHCAESSASLSPWLVHSADGAYRDVPASVPGDVVTDLWRAGHVDDPYRGRNFVTQQEVWMGTPYDPAATNGTERQRTWVYETNVSLPLAFNAEKAHRAYLLVLEGVKMGAYVDLNGVRLGVIRNQFVRTIFRLPARALARSSGSGGTSSLTVTFDPAIDTRGRFMACSGGWDWAPYTQAVDNRGSRVFTFGITNPAYVVEADNVWIEDVVTKIYPSGRGRTSNRGDFEVLVQVNLGWVESIPHGSDVSLRFQSEFSSEVVRVSVGAAQPIVNVSLAAKDVELWWPAGMGNHTLYKIRAALEHRSCCTVGRDDCNECPAIERRVGFRTLALITDNSTDKPSSTEGNGSGRHGMVVRVNGVDLWCRGANLIPMDQLEGRWFDRARPCDGKDSAYLWLVESARRAYMNMLRVWGGGSIPPREFYDSCDENGILIYQDLMFVEEDGHGAFEDDNVREEIAVLVRRLIHHPSIVLWNGCNECTTNDLYATFVMKTVADVDDTRVIWPGSPSWYGWESGVRTSDGKPNGQPLRIRQSIDAEEHQLELHGPYPRGYSNSYPGVNGVPAANSNETLLPPVFREEEVGMALPNTFISEFGTTAHSSFESMSQYVHVSEWSLHGGGSPDTCEHVWGNQNRCNGTNAMAERNYPADTRIAAYFGDDVMLDEVGPKAFQRQLYLSMMAQALWVKGQIETFRSGNSYGALIWQMNEIWPTGGWGCIEYHNGRHQLGRWKPLMFLLRSFLFRDDIVACGRAGLCYARNDNRLATDLNITLETWDLLPTSSEALRSTTRSISLPAGRSQSWFTISEDFLANAHAVLITVISASSSSTVPSNNAEESSVYLWTLPKDLPLHPTIRFDIQVEFNAHTDSAVVLDVSSSHLALYVFLSSGDMGHFSDNAFALRPGTTKRILFQPIAMDEFDRDSFVSALRVDHLGPSSTLSVVNKNLNKEHIMTSATRNLR